jgi:hypothetical protein
MTRDEAIAIAKHQLEYVNVSDAYIAAHIDVLVALGLLKLDEPKMPERIFIEAMRDYGYGITAARELLDRIEGAGLKLVEKDK